MPDFAVILPAAGKALRFGGEKNKLLYELRGRTILRRSIDAFLARRDVTQVVIPSNDPQVIAEVAKLNDVRVIVAAGGASRAQSVRNGLRSIRSVNWVAVHDAARPLISQDLIDSILTAAVKHGAAAPALPIALTVKQAAGPLPARVHRTVPRQDLWAMQTPQIMRRTDLMQAFDNCPLPLEDITDDVQLLELSGKDVWLVPGDERNLKITTTTDLRVADLLCVS